MKQAQAHFQSSRLFSTSVVNVETHSGQTRAVRLEGIDNNEVNLFHPSTNLKVNRIAAFFSFKCWYIFKLKLFLFQNWNLTLKSRKHPWGRFRKSEWPLSRGPFNAISLWGQMKQIYFHTHYRKEHQCLMGTKQKCSCQFYRKRLLPRKPFAQIRK